MLGLANFLAFSMGYMILRGEALSGSVDFSPSGAPTYHLRNADQGEVPTSRSVYIYSGIHSLSVWLTMAAVMLAMLTLAKERIVSAMRSTILRGRTLITILATLIVFITLMLIVWYGLQFASRFHAPHKVTPAALVDANAAARSLTTTPSASSGPVSASQP